MDHRAMNNIDFF